MKIAFFILFSETGGALNQTLGFVNLISKIKIGPKDQLCIISDKKINPDKFETKIFKLITLKKHY